MRVIRRMDLARDVSGNALFPAPHRFIAQQPDWPAFTVTQNPAAEDATARRDSAQRIGRFLRGLERARRQPNRREAYHLRSALEQLRAAQYSDSEAAMVNAERCAPLPAHVASLVTTNDTVTVAQLQKQLDEIVTALT